MQKFFTLHGVRFRFQSQLPEGIRIQWLIYIVKLWTRPPPPGGPNSFNFIQFLGKFGKIVCWRPSPLGSWRPLLGEILDPPLEYVSGNVTKPLANELTPVPVVASLCDLEADGCGCSDGLLLLYNGEDSTCVEPDNCACHDFETGRSYNDGDSHLDEETCKYW